MPRVHAAVGTGHGEDLQYTAHYHLERNHQGLDNQLIERRPANINGREGTVRRRERLGGVLSYYYRDAA